MPKPFARLEARTTASAFRLLSNCAAFIEGVEVDAIYSDGFALGQVGEVGMASSQPALALPTAQLPANPGGLQVVVDGKSYRIAEARHDGTGQTHLLLELP